MSSDAALSRAGRLPVESRGSQAVTREQGSGGGHSCGWDSEAFQVLEGKGTEQRRLWGPQPVGGCVPESGGAGRTGVVHREAVWCLCARTCASVCVSHPCTCTCASVCMCVCEPCVYMHLCICMYVHVCMYESVRVHTPVHLCVCVCEPCVYMHLCICVHISVCMHVWVHTPMHLWAYARVCVNTVQCTRACLCLCCVCWVGSLAVLALH